MKDGQYVGLGGKVDNALGHPPVRRWLVAALDLLCPSGPSRSRQAFTSCVDPGRLLFHDSSRKSCLCLFQLALIDV